MSNALRAAQRATQRILSGSKRIVPGQPIPETHPELLAAGDLQPGISAHEFALRRQALAEQLPPGGIAIIPAAPQIFMTGVIPFPYRQDADFQYLTGITQPSTLAIIQSQGRTAPHSLTLLVPDVDKSKEAWDGAVLNKDAAVDIFGADDAYTLSEAHQHLERLLSSAPVIALDVDKLDTPHTPATSFLRHLSSYQTAKSQNRLQPLRPSIHHMRWRKSEAETGVMRTSAAIASKAMQQCMEHSHDGVSEHSLAGLFEYKCRMEGAQRMSYPPVVAGGTDALTIHYSRNDKTLSNGQLLLLDGGCEYFGYCSDVTRTWPINSRFTGAQRALYEATLEVHKKLLAACKPGVTLRQLHQVSVKLLCEVLCTLGIVRNTSPEAMMADYSFRKFYPHSVGHWLGMDTHDSSTVYHDRPLEPGVALTIEPGLYIPDEDSYGAFRGIGIRLEDDVLITDAEGPEVLSFGAPIEIEHLEEIIGSAVVK